MKRALRGLGLLALAVMPVQGATPGISLPAAGDVVGETSVSALAPNRADDGGTAIPRSVSEADTVAVAETGPPAYLLALAGILLIGHIAARRRPGVAD